MIELSNKEQDWEQQYLLAIYITKQMKKEIIDMDDLIEAEKAIKCTMPMVGTVGYVANSCNTVAGGTMSAGRIYDKVEKKFYARVLFTTFTKIICRIEEGDPTELKKEILAQFDDSWDDDEDEDVLVEEAISDDEDDEF